MECDFAHRNAVARFFSLHKLSRYLIHILLIQRGAAEVGFDVTYGQDTPIAVVGLVCDIVFRNGGQHVQRNADGLDALNKELEEKGGALKEFRKDRIRLQNRKQED